MTLENLAEARQLKREPGDQHEFDGLLQSGVARLTDAHSMHLSLASRFDLAYNASHALALAALRWHGFRADNRYMVFQCLQHTLAVGPDVWRVLDHCHHLRNRGEYEGFLDVTETLVHDLIGAAESVREKVCHLGPVPG